MEAEEFFNWYGGGDMFIRIRVLRFLELFRKRFLELFRKPNIALIDPLSL